MRNPVNSNLHQRKFGTVDVRIRGFTLAEAVRDCVFAARGETRFTLEESF